MFSRTPIQEIACQQVLTENGTVFSVQWTDIPNDMADTLTVDFLLERYLTYIKKCTATLIRPTYQQGGIEFRLIGTGVSLISFMPPEHRNSSVTLRICGGFLVQPRQCNRGELRFGIAYQTGTARISLQLSDFCPLILGSHSPSLVRLWLYRFTQAALHRLVTVRFLMLLYREIAGTSARVKIINAGIRNGIPV